MSTRIIEKKYYPIPTTNQVNNLRVDFQYNLGGYNMGTGQYNKRGYYVSIKPVTIEEKWGGVIESYMGFTGSYMLIKEVSRQSKKAEKEARSLMQQAMDYLMKVVCNENQIPVPEEARWDVA